MPFTATDDSAVETPRRRAIVNTLLPVGLGLLLSLVFWGPLWRGGGFVGGDVYSYYLPQKVFYAAALERGELPLWNSWTGHGYPILGESQTGALYPPWLVLYRLLSVHAAYHAGWLLHFALAAVAAWLLARQLGLSRVAAGLTAVVYACGWFPVRTCWEWSVATGAWLPLAVWCAERFLGSRLWRYAIGLAVVLCLQLLAGHYHVSFLTLLLLAGYVPLRLWWAESPHTGEATGVDDRRTSGRGALACGLVCAVLAGYGLAAVQLLPTRELQQHSQRAVADSSYDPRAGSLPAWYWTQMIAPWYWYVPAVQRDNLLGQWASMQGTRTNQIEAHLYCGLIPLMLCGLAIVGGLRRGHRLRLLWAAVGIAALLMTPGWLVPLMRHLPGFGYFQGPGRYGLLTTLSVAILAGCGLDDCRRRVTMWKSLVLAAGLAYCTLSLRMLYSETAAVYEAAGLPLPLELWGIHLSPGPVVLLLDAIFALVLLCGVRTILRRGAARRGIATGQVAATAARSASPGTAGCVEELQIEPATEYGPTRTGHRAAAVMGTMTVLVIVLTTADLWLVSRQVTYSPMVSDPPLARLEESFIRRELAEFGAGARLSAPYMNLPAVFGAGTFDPYFTFGPAAYAKSGLEPMSMARSAEELQQETTARQIRQLQDAGVTHILALEPLDRKVWPVREVRSGIDPVFNPALGRYRQPVTLYRLEGGRGRISIGGGKQVQRSHTHLLEDTPGRIAGQVSLEAERQVVLTELYFPGWQVQIDGEPARLELADGMFQAVTVPAGDHQLVWEYRPRSVRTGAIISLVTLLILATVAHLRFWHPDRLSRWLRWNGSRRASSETGPASVPVQTRAVRSRGEAP